MGGILDLGNIQTSNYSPIALISISKTLKMSTLKKGLNL
jgi:hypothetical protein